MYSKKTGKWAKCGVGDNKVLKNALFQLSSARPPKDGSGRP